MAGKLMWAVRTMFGGYVAYPHWTPSDATREKNSGEHVVRVRVIEVKSKKRKARG